MIRKLSPNLQEKEKIGYWLLGQKINLAKIFFYLLILFLPIQLGYHFWPKSAYVYGLRIDYLSPTLYLTDIIILFILFFYFPNLLRLIKKNVKKTIFIIGLLVILFTSAFFAENQFAAIYGIFKFLEFLFLGIFIANGKKNNTTFSYLLAIPIIYESLITLAQFLNQSSLNGIFYFLGERKFTGLTPGIANASLNGELILRPYGTFSHPNVLAGFLVLSMTILIVQFVKQKKATKYFILGSLILGTIALFLTLSRVAIILWIVLLPFIILTKNNMNKKTIYVFFGIFIFFMFCVLNTPLLLRFTQISLIDEAFVQRQLFLKEAFDLFLKHPILGVGLNNFIVSIPSVMKPSELNSLQPVHNIFVLNLVETGIIGSLFFLYFLFLTIKKNYKKKIFILSIFSIFFLGFFDHYFLTLQQGQIMLTVFLGLWWGKNE